MGMLAEIRAGVAAFASSFDAALISPADAERVVRDAAAIENMAATIKALAAARAAKGGEWRRNGAKSPAHDLARKTGTTVAKAKEALDTGEKLAELPALDAAARSGELSPAQAAPIAEAASVAPEAESRLVAKAKRTSVGELREECDRTKAAAETDAEARRRAIHRSRSLRSFKCADGAGEIRYRSTLDEVAELMSVIRGYGNREFDLARLEGRREPEEAYLADGLLAACRVAAGVANGEADTVTATAASPAGDAVPAAAPPFPAGAETRGPTAGEDPAAEPPAALDLFGDDLRAGASPAATPPVLAPAPTASTPSAAPPAGRVRKPTPTKIVVRLDWDAFIRGFPIDGEVCEIAGIGAVPVSVVRAMMASGDAFLAAVVTKGVDVVSVAHLGRRPTAYQSTALDWLAPTCTTEGCNNAVRLETDHREDWAKTKITRLRWLDRLCEHCHDSKTRRGWALIDGHGKRPLVPPDDVRHPRHRPPDAGAG
jgi:hypothetical protein